MRDITANTDTDTANQSNIGDYTVRISVTQKNTAVI